MEKYFYPYVLNLFELACEKRWNSANAEALLQECIDKSLSKGLIKIKYNKIQEIGEI